MKTPDGCRLTVEIILARRQRRRPGVVVEVAGGLQVVGIAGDGVQIEERLVRPA